MRASLITLLSLFALTACNSTASLVELKHVAPSNDPYSAALATRYQDFAEEKLNKYDWWTSKYFADKGLLASYGKEVTPEDPKNWDIAQSLQGELAAAREKLMAAVAANKAGNPTGSAEAVVDYDRLIEVEDKGWDDPRIEAARDRFFAALGKLASPDASNKHAPQPVETTSTILYFPFDSDKLTPTARAALEELVKYVQSAGPASIVINGHADRAGSETYNMTLSEHRAKFVMRALVKAGVPEKLVQYFAFGETDPAVPTADGVAEPRNRRVEIFLE